MSLSSATARVDYVGSGSTATYSYTFRVFDQDHIRAIVRSPVSGAETELALTAHYTVTGVNEASGGTIVLVNGAFDWIDASGKLDDDWALTIKRIVPLTQEADVRNQGAYFPEIHENEFDMLVMADQQQQDDIDRSVKLPETVAASGFDTTLPSDIALQPGSAIIVNDAGDGLSLGATEVLASDRIFKSDTLDNLKILSAATPTLQRYAYATDLQNLMFYCADVSVGDLGWFPIGG